MIWFLLFIPIILILYILYKCVEFWDPCMSEWLTITKGVFLIMSIFCLIPFVNIVVFAICILLPLFAATDGNVRFRKYGSKFFEYLNSRL